MALITTNYIGDMSATNGSNNPEGGDTRRDGDDNMRAIQGTIRRTFPNFGSPSKAVTPTEDELNTLAGVSTTEKIVTLPDGNTTPIMFYLDSAPPGWTITQAVDEHSVRLTKGSANLGQAGGMSGGSNDFSVQFSDYLTESDSAHNHQVSGTTSGGSTGLTYNSAGGPAPSPAGHTHTFSVTTNTDGAHTHTVNLKVKWAACIMASMD